LSVSVGGVVVNTSLAIGAGKAKTGAAAICGEYRRNLRTNVQIADTARKVFPIKTALHLSEITEYPLRTVESWLTAEVKIPSDALAMLLRSEYGAQFLSAVMVDAVPQWWRKTLSYFAALDAMSMQRKARRKLREAIDADVATTTAIARADALLLQDENFYGAHADALRSVARVPDRALAQTAGKVKR
jgi:hypothetical protein